MMLSLLKHIWVTLPKWVKRLHVEWRYTDMHLSPSHDDVIKWKHFSRNWPFVRGIHRSPVNSPHKGQWCGALMFSFIYVWINDWVNNREAGDLRRHPAHSDVIVMSISEFLGISIWHSRVWTPANSVLDNCTLIQYTWIGKSILWILR